MSERPSLEKSMATVIISALLIFIIGTAFLFSRKLPGNIRNSSSGTPSSPSSPSTSPSPASASGENWWEKACKVNWAALLLGMVAAYLLARMTVLGGVLPGGEIFILAIITGIAFGINRKLGLFALLIAGVLLVNFLHPSINQDAKGMRENKINPPGEMSPIVINHDGEYDLPDRPLKVCFTMTGDPKKGEYISQQIQINTWKHLNQVTSDCINIPETEIGKKANIILGPYGRKYTQDIKKKWGFGPDINNDYDYYIKVIGVGAYPTIQAR